MVRSSSLLNRLFSQGSRYTVVAATCAALHNIIMIVLDYVGVYYGLSLLISTSILIPTGFILHCRLTFSVEQSWPAFWRYGGVMAVNMPLSFAFIWLIYDIIGLPMIIAAPVATVLLFVWNFLAARWAVNHRPLKAS